jgi:hypothetical protein
MRSVFIFVVLLYVIAFDIQAQNGYIITLDADSAVYGYLKRYVSYSKPEQGIELWKTKKDKNPQRIATTDIFEYAIKKDTFRVLQNFKPFPGESLNFDLIEATVVCRGKLDLYIIEHFTNPKAISNATMGGLIPALIDAGFKNLNYMYILEESETRYMRAVSPKNKKFDEVLSDFFPAEFLDTYRKNHKKINYDSLPDMVKSYNTTR